MTLIAPRTVTGGVVGPGYDLVLAHEHLRIDIRCWFAAESEHAVELSELEVTPENAPRVQRDPFACLDNLVLDDAAVIADELGDLAGRATSALIIDVTPENVGRDVGYLRTVSERTGVDVVYGCGLYIDESRPGEVVGPPEAYRDAICAQFDHEQRPAVIGEIGSGDPITPTERASLIGAAMAQAEVGVPLYVHLHPWARRGVEVLDLVAKHGAELERTVLCHLDVQIPGGLDYHRELLGRGCTIAFDIWGDEFAYGDAGMPTDGQRLEATLRLIDEGFGERLVHSHDVCTKTQLRRFGGAGFAHLPGAVREWMRAVGLDQAEIHRQLAGNALALLGADSAGDERDQPTATRAGSGDG